MTHRLHLTRLILSHKYIIHNILSDTAVTSVTGLYTSIMLLHTLSHLVARVNMYRCTPHDCTLSQTIGLATCITV